MQLPVFKTLKNGMTIALDEMLPSEREIVRSLLNTVVMEGQTYPHLQPLSEAEFAAYWLVQDAFVVRKVEASDRSQSMTGEILGAFYLKPNFPGRCSHICNAGFIVQPAARGLGIGRFMGEAMLAIAPTRSYTAVMFNLVFASNTASLKLWESLGFTAIGRIPNAVRLEGDRHVDACMLYRCLESRSNNLEKT
ncbi:GNAT family N-acetyltransferase [Microcoleus sp. FACHB-1515]|uniref:GNAT family N-acetyltransferase n=1 Tax=Cyanophyceae TaxID=3028117 RepID=UPI001686DA5A|nr:N-acetyltransferase [Microcoleus sp. FACHB-1515]MBD2092114.1 GNAT family N-acetyltransferase [Microcoleus sp. FACHB-1515]